MTVAEYFDQWLARQRLRLQPSTWDAYRLTLDCYLIPALGSELLESIDPMRLEQLYIDLLDHGGRNGRSLSIGTIRYIHAVLHKALADAVRTGLLADNASDRTTLPRIDPRADSRPASGIRVWTAAQARRFLESTARDRHGDLWAAALGTGMRRGELLGLRWSDVASDGRQLRVASSLTIVDGDSRLKATKTNRVRHLHVDARTADAIDRARASQKPQRRQAGWRNELDLVFTDEIGQPLVPQRITHRFRRLVRRLDVPTIRLHDLRHTHTTLLLQAGVPIKVVSERLGHSTIALTMDVYAHVLPAMDRDAADRFGDLLA
jgi:integrase